MPSAGPISTHHWNEPQSADAQVRRRSSTPAILESATLLVAATLIAFQLFVPPVIGMADNGDFAKVAGRLCMQPPDPILHSEARYFRFFLTDYEIAPQHCVVFWQWSSMSIVAWVAKQLHDLVGRESSFDLRAVGVVCTILWLACAWAVLRLIRNAPSRVRIAAAIICVVVLTDVLYVAYFQSLYGDAAAILFLFGCCVLAWRATQARSNLLVLAFAATAALLIWSKGPHVLIAPWLVAFACFWWWRTGLQGWGWGAALLVAATASSLWSTPSDYGTATTFNVIFARLLPEAQDPVPVLAEFDLPPDAAKYKGEYVYTPTTPFKDVEWRTRHAASLTPERLVCFYARHPGWMVQNLWSDLVDSADMHYFIRYRREDGQPADRSAPSLLGWSSFRSLLLRWVPWHLPLFYAAVFIAGIALVWRGTESWQRVGGSLCVALAGAGVSEFASSSLFDSLETGRHLFMFHVLTDVLLVHAALAVAWWSAAPRVVRST